MKQCKDITALGRCAIEHEHIEEYNKLVKNLPIEDYDDTDDKISYNEIVND